MQQPHIFPLSGGLDLITPDLLMRDGMAIGGYNYEPDQQGYRRFDGYERFDGREAPSAATYYTIDYTGGSGASTPVATETVTGGTSGATATLLATVEETSGSFAGADGAGYVAVYNVTGTFQAGEALTFSGGGTATSSTTAIAGGAPTNELDTTWMGLVRADRRASITAVPGSGAVRGVHAYGGDVWAIRDNAGGTAGVLHKATTSGWAAQSLGSLLDFDAGTAAFVEGETVTGGTSGATATVRRVVLQSGTYSGSDADGFLVLSGITGTFQNNEALSGSVAGAATADGTVQAITLPAGGRYSFVNHNFRGAASGVRMYFAGGVGRAMEWDGTVCTPIRTGLSDALDKPTHIAEYKDHLFLGYSAGSWLHSEIGEPLQYRVVGGAGEIAVGAEPTGAENAAGVLVLFSRTRIDYIGGSSSADFQREPLSETSGAQAWATQMIATPLYMSDLNMYALLQSGDTLAGWRMSSMSQQIEPLLRALRAEGLAPVASMRVRNRDLYRVYFSNGTGLSAYLGREVPEIMRIQLPITAHCAYSGDDLGKERLFLGATNGFVYEIDSGMDFDGATLDAIVRLGFTHCQQPRRDKRFHWVELEMEGGETASIFVSADFDYGDPVSPASPSASAIVSGSGGFWDISSWDRFNWDAAVVGRATAEMNGFGRNISVAIGCDVAGEAPHTLSNLTIYHTMRRARR